MRHMYACAASFALFAACAASPPGGAIGQPGTDVKNGVIVPDPGGVKASCPLGAATFTLAMGMSDEGQILDLSADRAGNVAFAAGPAKLSGELTGVVDLSSSGDVRFTLPLGSVVATDVAGNIYVAGSFAQPIDLGLGVMPPQGDVDVFVAKLDSHGRVLFARALGLCGDDVQSIAADATGRIAVSGAGMGTAVLSPAGDLQFQLAFAGDLAFDSKGNLVVAGSFQTIDLGDGLVTAEVPGTDVFVIEVDPDGCRLFSRIMPSNGTFSTATSVAIGPSDEIVLVGYTFGSIDLLGTTVTATEAGENGRVTGAFAVKLDSAGNAAFVHDLGIVEANGVAIDATGRIAINGALTGGAGFLRRLVIETFDAAGNRLQHLEEHVASGYGRGFAVGFDACGSIYAALVALDTPNRLSPLRSYVAKLAL